MTKIYKISGDRLWVWDDGPLENFGQMWIPICPGCGNGPTDHLVCGECDAEERTE